MRGGFIPAPARACHQPPRNLWISQKKQDPCHREMARVKVARACARAYVKKRGAKRAPSLQMGVEAQTSIRV